MTPLCDPITRPGARLHCLQLICKTTHSEYPLCAGQHVLGIAWRVESADGGVGRWRSKRRRSRMDQYPRCSQLKHPPCIIHLEDLIYTALHHKVRKKGHFYQFSNLLLSLRHFVSPFNFLSLTRHLLTRLLRPQDPMFVFDFVFVLSLPSDSPESPKPPNFTGIISLRIITPVCRHQKSLLAASRV